MIKTHIGIYNIPDAICAPVFATAVNRYKFGKDRGVLINAGECYMGTFVSWLRCTDARHISMKTARLMKRITKQMDERKT